MSRYHFTLRVPADPPYRALAGGVAGRYLEGLGAQASACVAFRASVDQAAANLAVGADAVDLSFASTPSGVEVTISAGARQHIVTQSL